MVMNGNGKWVSWIFIYFIYRELYHFSTFRFCPSVFFYLCTVIPSVWFLELDLAERRLNFNVTQALGLIPANSDIDDSLPVRKSTENQQIIIFSF